MWRTQVNSLLGVTAFAPVYEEPKKVKEVRPKKEKREGYNFSPSRKVAALAAFAKSHMKQGAKKLANKEMLRQMIVDQEMSAPEMMEPSGLSDRYICKVLLEMADEGKVTYVIRKIGRNHTRFWRAV